ncbi:polyhydroxyalkanoic acid system family protein [Pararhizobium haloflavum]|uniref:polyhydroxyalkanoic acid system family protein n=1 Tax=Pararhizobium haloflavum TaxID=2037914 RepID=UPI000C19005E|nr:polyhydroxyalkanoic acid system family protein [Pararhizobium haloflavum]
MAETINVEIPHRLTRLEARQRLEGGLQRVHEQVAGRAVSLEQQWSGDHLDFKAGMMGQTITGRLDIEDSVVRLELDLPWLLASIANSLKGRLKKEGTLLLEKK